jgi:LuxR family maltose regulon positive regulatory protein
MPEALIETKLLLPRSRQRVVPRSRLEALLRHGIESRLTLVAAPAGFGKTTLLRSWLGAGSEGPTAWVSLDERDADASTFWRYVLHAVNRAIPGAATPALAQFGSGQAAIDDVLSTLINELGVTPNDLTVVLDDYHLAESPTIQAGLSFLVEHLPPQVHLVISTRADPDLPLARLRARGELIEIRADDLRFTIDEAAAYLNEVNTLDLDASAVAVLENRTEGWAAALQLAALSLRGRGDPDEFIADFAGDDRFVVDYLADEVLDRQPPAVRTFLLDTSVLEQLTGALCDAVTGRTGGREMLEWLERQNLFLVPLDDRRRWYRYHHLFADVLRTRLLDERPGDAPVLHRRASDWFDQEGEPEPAVRHAWAAGDKARAADRIEIAIPALLKERREAVVRQWADEIPTDLLRNRPVLAIGIVAGLMSSNEFDGVEQRLRDVEALLAAPVEDLIVVDEAEFSRLPASVQTYRAAHALVNGDVPGTVERAQRALLLAAHDDHLSIASASALLGIAYWTNGDLDAAHQAYGAAAEHLKSAGHVADVLGCSITLADLEMTQGRLGQAQATFERALALAASEGSVLRGVADMYVGLSRVSWEQGDHSAAAAFLGKADEVGDSAGLPQNPYRWRVMMACVRQAEGDTATALDLLEDAQRVYVGDFAPNVRPIASVRARVLAKTGDLTAARTWVHERGVSVADELTYLSEYDHLTLARVLLAEHAADQDHAALADATGLLSRILAAALEGGRTGTVIETLVLLALAQQAAANAAQAVSSLTEALRLAEPEGYVRVFTQEGAAMQELLGELTRRHVRNPFAQRILRACAAARERAADISEPSAASVPDSGTDHGGDVTAVEQTRQALIEPLSDRELDVLRLLGSELGGPEIARKLHVSLSTVRTHTQHIYAKLGVNNRRAAVRRAHQLNIFSRPTR